MRDMGNNVAGAPAASASGISKGEVIARIERLPATPLHVRARILIGAATFFDGFDVITIATTLPLLIHKWALTPAQIGFLIACGSIGQLFGALLFPWLAEHYGRVRAIAWSSGIIGVTSIACGFAPTLNVFIALRVIQGLGLGGELPVAATYINEVTRAHGRGRFVLLYEIVFPIGLLASNALGAWVVPRFGWQAMYFIGGLPLILFLVLRRVVPESPRWLGERGRFAQADAALARFEASSRQPLPPLTQVEDFENLVQRHPRRKPWDLFGRAYLKRTLAVAMLWITCGCLQYGLSTLLPTIYQKIYHAPLQLALNLAMAASVLGVLGSLACALLVDKLGRKPIINVSFLFCAVSLALAGVFHDASVYVVATCCAFALGWMACGFITAYVYTPELYPTSIRALSCGVGSAWLKVAAIFAPGPVAHALAGGHLDTTFYVLAAVPFLAAIVVHFLSIETKGQVLEQLEV
jgi:MFS transporter, putative metabolite:H+ symporter